MVIRGAPVIGVAGAYGVVLAAIQYNGSNRGDMDKAILASTVAIKQARPTAVNLGWAVDRMITLLDDQNIPCLELKDKLLAEAEKIADEDVETCRRIAKNGQDIIQDGDVIIHHCNTGSLATVEGGTALGVILEACKQGKNIRVLVDETRPRLQGARLTAWELEQAGIPYQIIADGAAGYFLQKHIATKVMFGADRVARNGDLANKIGTYPLALAAHENGIPVYPAFPLSSYDSVCPDGNSIPIEFRDEGEILNISQDGKSVYPQNAHGLNPSFDITPHDLITAWITDMGIIYPPFKIEENFEKFTGEHS
jgi:methylthioribose-1-phosphate isomerase